MKDSDLRHSDWTAFLLPLDAGQRSESARASSGRPGMRPAANAGFGHADEPRVSVLTNPSRRDLQAASSEMREGDWTFIQWTSPQWEPLPRLRARLAAAGLRTAHVFSTWPASSTPRIWFPAAAPAALSYFADHFLAGPRLDDTGWAKLNSLAKRGLLPLVGLRSRRVLASTSPPGAPGAEIPLLGWVRKHWTAWGFERAPDALTCLMITDGYRDTNKRVLLVFSEPESLPLVAIKLPRLREAAGSLEREAAALEFLERSGGLPGFPKPIWHGRLGEMPALVQTALPGRPVGDLVDLKNWREVALRATDWLAELAIRTAREGHPDRWERLVGTPLGELQSHDNRNACQPVIERLALTPDSLSGLPAIMEHRDFSPWNVMLSPGGEIGAVDWESAETAGIPGLDLFYFLAYLGLHVHGIPYSIASGELRTAYRHALDPSTPAGALRTECLNRYSEKLGIPARRLEALAPVAWIIHAKSELRNFARDAGRAPDDDALSRSVFLAFLAEESDRRSLVSAHGQGSVAQLRRP